MPTSLRECFPAHIVGSSGEYKELSPGGQETSYRFSRLHDLEDDDKHETVKIGTLILQHDDEMGRDFARETFTVSYQGNVVCRSCDQRARGSRFNRPMSVEQGTAAQVLVVLGEVAALEQLSLEDFVAQLPPSFSWVLNMPGSCKAGT